MTASSVAIRTSSGFFTTPVELYSLPKLFSTLSSCFLPLLPSNRELQVGECRAPCVDGFLVLLR